MQKTASRSLSSSRPPHKMDAMLHQMDWLVSSLLLVSQPIDTATMFIPRQQLLTTTTAALRACAHSNNSISKRGYSLIWGRSRSRQRRELFARRANRFGYRQLKQKNAIGDVTRELTSAACCGCYKICKRNTNSIFPSLLSAQQSTTNHFPHSAS
jgi:hypothetical protein